MNFGLPDFYTLIQNTPRHLGSIPSYTTIRKNLPIRFHKFSGVDEYRADTESLGAPKRQKIVGVCSVGLDFILLT